MMPVLLAVEDQGLEEFLRDPLLTIACVLLISVSIAWIIIVRLIVHNLRRAVRRRGRPMDDVVSARDIWTMPP